MGYRVETCYKTESEFIRKIELLIKTWEELKLAEGREEEYQNVIWGAHRILDMLMIEYEDNNDVF